jgi:NADH:ubiquinone oxidoreductase subunit F (NADH-binding)/NADH:ubiquinone oxidoreductase subunit E
MIVQRLREIQNRFGCLPDEELRRVAREAGVPLYKVEEISSFFPSFRLQRSNPAEIELKICRDMACHLRGASALLDEKVGLPVLAEKLSAATGKKICVEGVSCLGRCDRAPVATAERWPMPAGEHAWMYAKCNQKGLEEVLQQLAAGNDPPKADSDKKYLPNTNVFPANATVKETPPGTFDPYAVPTPGWEIDVYGREGWQRDYRAVRQFIDYLAARVKPLEPPPKGIGGKDLETYVKENHPQLWELKEAGLLGMGGAGAPAYQKWLDVWREPAAEKYIVMNGDESEPGTFKDRELLLRHPHLVVEGMILAGLMTGAVAGYIYIRHEYQEQIHAVRDEIARAQKLGACGQDIFDSERSFTVEVFESPGGYICGEQSALIEAMEDRRSQPRNRPPELTTNGLRDRPTVVNNVETLSWTPAIMLRKGTRYATAGWPVPEAPKPLRFNGRRLFSISGDVRRPGVFEVPIGLPFRDLIEKPEFCGGVIGGKLKAIAPSGPSGGLMPARLPVDPRLDARRRSEAVSRIRDRSAADADLMEWFLATHVPMGATHCDLLAVPLDLTFFRNMQGVLKLPVEPMLGAGIVVYAEGTDLLDHALNFTQFYRNESCGKCVPCRIGSQKLVQIGSDMLERRNNGNPLKDKEAEVLGADIREMTQVLQLTSICGLGYVAPMPLATALAYFQDDIGKKPRG